MLAIETVPVEALIGAIAFTTLVVGVMAFNIGRDAVRRARVGQEVKDFWVASRTFNAFVVAMGMITEATAQVYNQTPSTKPDFTIELMNKHRDHEPFPVFTGMCKGLSYKFEPRKARVTICWMQGTFNKSVRESVEVPLDQPIPIYVFQDLCAMIARKKATS